MADVQYLDLSNALVTPELLAALGDCTGVRTIDLDCSTLNDRLFTFFPVLPQLRGLYLKETAITDAAIPLICQQPDLRVLHLDNTSITDNALAQLAEYRPLEMLSLNDTAIGDDGISHLAGSSISDLDLAGTKITDSSIDVLNQLPTLSMLDVQHTGVTMKALDQLLTRADVTIVGPDGSEYAVDENGMVTVSLPPITE